MVPGLWLNEGGQSATGSLVDHVIKTHAGYSEAKGDALTRGCTIYEWLNDRVAALSSGLAFPALLKAGLHVQPDFHGNRSPRADATLRGMISGLSLSASLDNLALLYLATVQAVAYGTRHIVETMNAAGYAMDTILACGGGTKNPVFLREHADATGCIVVLPREPEAVLLGAAVLGAVAGAAYHGVREAMAGMSATGSVIAPSGADVQAFHDRKYAVHWLKAVKAAGTVASGPVMTQMRAIPVNDFMTHDGTIRADGRMLRDMYLMQAKAPADSKGEWDLMRVVATIPAAEAWRPMAEGGCPMVP